MGNHSFDDAINHTNSFEVLKDTKTKTKKRVTKATRKVQKRNLKRAATLSNTIFNPTPAELQSIISNCNEDPKYIIIKAKDTSKKLSTGNLFIITEPLEGIFKSIKTFRTNAEGNTILLGNNENTADLFIKKLQTHTLNNIEVSAELQANMNISKGFVYSPFFKNLSIKEIAEGINSFRVGVKGWKIKYSRHITRMYDGARVNTGRFILTLNPQNQ